MKNYFLIILAIAFTFISCKPESIENEIPFTTLEDVAPEFKYVIRHLAEFGGDDISEDFIEKAVPYFVVINNQNDYLEEIYSRDEHPKIDFSNQTLLAIALGESSTQTKFHTQKRGDKVILNITQELYKYGPTGVLTKFYTVIIPKTEAENVEFNHKVIKMD